jgi:drug/metabolite transporter (DMT)-like permease
MIARLAYTYVGLLLVVELLLFISSLLLHLSVLIGARAPFAEYGLMLFRGTVIVGVPATAFIKDSLRWRDQIKSCSKWMWKTALGAGIYGLFIFCLQAILAPKHASLSDMALTLSGIPLGFDAITFCILYSVLWRDYLEQSEVARRTLHSVLFVVFGVAMFLAYRAGYLHHPKNY